MGGATDCRGTNYSASNSLCWRMLRNTFGHGNKVQLLSAFPFKCRSGLFWAFETVENDDQKVDVHKCHERFYKITAKQHRKSDNTVAKERTFVAYLSDYDDLDYDFDATPSISGSNRRASAAGKGVATAMCEHSQREAVRLGYSAMQFNLVVSSNAVAVRLWQKCGFRIVGQLPGAFNHARLGLVDAYVMYKWLLGGE